MVIIYSMNFMKWTLEDLKGKIRREAVGYIPQEPSDLLYGQSVQGECQQADKDNQRSSGSTFALLQRIVPSINPQTHPRDLSEGQRLALALAIVLSAQPKVLILDEPTRGIDVGAKGEIFDLLRERAEKGLAVLFVTSEISEAMNWSDRIVVMSRGHIVGIYKPADVTREEIMSAAEATKEEGARVWI